MAIAAYLRVSTEEQRERRRGIHRERYVVGPTVDELRDERADSIHVVEPCQEVGARAFVASGKVPIDGRLASPTDVAPCERLARHLIGSPHRRALWRAPLG